MGIHCWLPVHSQLKVSFCKSPSSLIFFVGPFKLNQPIRNRNHEFGWLKFPGVIDFSQRNFSELEIGDKNRRDGDREVDAEDWQIQLLWQLQQDSRIGNRSRGDYKESNYENLRMIHLIMVRCMILYQGYQYMIIFQRIHHSNRLVKKKLMHRTQSKTPLNILLTSAFFLSLAFLLISILIAFFQNWDNYFYNNNGICPNRMPLLEKSNVFIFQILIIIMASLACLGSFITIIALNCFINKNKILASMKKAFLFIPIMIGNLGGIGSQIYIIKIFAAIISLQKSWSNTSVRQTLQKFCLSENSYNQIVNKENIFLVLMILGSILIVLMLLVFILMCCSFLGKRENENKLMFNQEKHSVMSQCIQAEIQEEKDLSRNQQQMKSFEELGVGDDVVDQSSSAILHIEYQSKKKKVEKLTISENVGSLQVHESQKKSGQKKSVIESPMSQQKSSLDNSRVSMKMSRSNRKIFEPMGIGMYYFNPDADQDS